MNLLTNSPCAISWATLNRKEYELLKVSSKTTIPSDNSVFQVVNSLRIPSSHRAPQSVAIALGFDLTRFQAPQNLSQPEYLALMLSKES